MVRPGGAAGEGAGRQRRTVKFFDLENFFLFVFFPWGKIFSNGPQKKMSSGLRKGAYSLGHSSSLASIPREGSKLEVGGSFSRKRGLGGALDSTLWFSGLGLRPKKKLGFFPF